MLKGEKARQLIARFPNLSKMQLAKILYKENNAMFKDIESARSIIRAVTGSNGKKNSKTYIQTDKYIGNVYESEPETWDPFILNTKNIGFLCDIHFPYHCQESLNCALEYLYQSKVDSIVIGGDLLDCYMLSRFDKDPGHRMAMWDEIRIMLNFFSDLRKNFPNIPIIYKLGNHDERYERWIYQKAPEIMGFPVLDLNYLINIHGMNADQQLEAEARKITIVKNKNIIKAGKINIIHGHEFNGSGSPSNPAMGFFKKGGKANVIGGHHHKISEYIESNINDEITGAWSVGCLCTLRPLYAPINQWCNGVARIEIDGDLFTVHNKKIRDGRIL